DTGGRNDERLLEAIVALDQRSAAGQLGFELREHRLELRHRLGRRDGIIERERFFIERQALALQHRHARAQRPELARQILPPQPPSLPAGGGAVCNAHPRPRNPHIPPRAGAGFTPPPASSFSTAATAWSIAGSGFFAVSASVRHS